MQTILALSLSLALAAQTGSGTAAGSATSAAGAQAARPGTPVVAFEIHEVRASGPEWRGALLPRLEPIARREGAAVWAVDEKTLKEFLAIFQKDARGSVHSAPRMVVPVGQPARMTNAEAIKYVASLRRVADAPPGQASRVAFEPQLDEVHSGVQVRVLSSRLKGPALFARVEIDENRLVRMHTTHYSETVNRKMETSSHEGKGLIHDRLHRNIGIERQAIKAAIQVPEVDSRRVEGEWLIPASGALLVSLGPRTRSTGLKTEFEERVIAITARPVAGQADGEVQKAGATALKAR